MTLLIWVWLVCVTAAVWLCLRSVYSTFSGRGARTPRVLPVFGTQAKVLLRREHFTDDLVRNYRKFHDQRFYGTYQLLTPLLVVRDLELVKRIAVKDFEHFLDHRSVLDEKQEPLFSRNLISLKGQEWKDMRSTLSPAFTSSKMKQMLPLMVEVGDRMMLSLKNSIQQSEVGYIDIDVKDLTTRYANDVIASCAFGLRVDSQLDKDNQFYEMGKTTSSVTVLQLTKMIFALVFPKLFALSGLSLFPKTAQTFFRRLVMDTMRDRELNGIVRPDMIHLLMEAKKGKLVHDEKSQEKGRDAGFAAVEESSVGKEDISRVWSDDDLTAQAILFFIAGFETVSSAMSFLLHELTVNPDVQERLYEEIKKNEEKNWGKFDYNSIQNMVYMDMVVSETLRLWPPGIALDRVCVRDYNLGKPEDNAAKEYIVRKGEGIQIPVWAIHRDPQFYPNPDKFDPERFSDDNKHNIQPFTYMPFGLGPRNCIGSRFALCEVKVLAYQLLKAVRLEPCEKTNVSAKLDAAHFNIRIKGGHWARFRARQ